jgi:alpha-glucosidase
MEVDLGRSRLAITPVSPSVLRIRFSSTGRWRPRRSWAVTRPLDGRQAPASEITSSAAGLRLATEALTVEIDSRGRLTVRDAGGRALIDDGEDGGVAWQDDPARCRWTQVMPDARRYFGFGERTGLLDKRGRRYTCWTTDEWRHQGPGTDALYVAVPFYLALDPDGTSFGVFLDTTFRSEFDLTDLDRGRITMSAETDELDWYLIHGPEPAGVVESFTDLVGRASMPPRWVLGYHQARWSYASEAEVLEIARALRQHAFPADVIHLDIDHMDDYSVFTWDAERFPDPARLAAELEKLGLRLTVVVDAAVKRDPHDPTYAEGHDRGFFVRESGRAGAPEFTGYQWGGVSVLPDHTRHDVRRWWGERYGGYLDVGVAGFLNDMNEPAIHDLPFDDPRSQNAEPPAETPFGAGSESTTHAEVRNMYGSLEAMAAAEGLAAARPGIRPFVITRAGFAGIQRHAAVWTGDNGSYWEHLEMSLPQLLNLGLSGIPIAGADIGGFFADCPPELLVRWMQLGAIYPFARNNSAKGTARQEPWVWGEPTTTRCRRAIELRYRLLPYLYGLVREAIDTGWPILRPLFFHHPGDPVAQGVEDAALLGRDLLVAPVLRPGKTHREVTVPPGDWCDIRDGTWHPGGGTVLLSAGLDQDMPILARAGSVVPMGPVMSATDAGPLDPLVLHVFPRRDGSAEGTLYEDDGRTTAYRDGISCLTRFAARDEGNATLLSARREGPHPPPPRTVQAVVHARDGDRRAIVADAAGWDVVL